MWVKISPIPGVIRVFSQPLQEASEDVHPTDVRQSVLGLDPLNSGLSFLGGKQTNGSSCQQASRSLMRIGTTARAK